MTKNGFTFIEILITISVIAVLFVPIMQLFSHALVATNENFDFITATNLAKSEMEKVINLNMTKEQLKTLGDQVIPPLNQKPLEVNRTLWRVKRELIPDSDPLEVRIQVYKEGEPGKYVVTLVTLVEDMMWESVKSVPTG